MISLAVHQNLLQVVWILNVALGTARELLYLHKLCDPKIIYRNFKAANVLLDDYYPSKRGGKDFALGPRSSNQIWQSIQ
ncbi:hypothetical protein CDL15_Pgr001787 [Punica granatum]|uniref:Protein kinase domain-containing protein n=1 Tax=Punica granatum TaxID=22663 RepID=A0A218XB95_PUNGR|nr:hypothetical protein CDL15_Pgr001787 [Punica granatum]